MNNHKMTYGLVAFYAATVFVVGCIPEKSLEWSEDGSVGLLRVDEALGLVDGETGELTLVAENVGLLPDISKDGTLIAYSEKTDCSSLSEGLKLLPPNQVKMIKHCAEQMRKDILDGHGRTSDKVPFPAPEEGPLVPNDYRNWAIRYLCENVDNELLQIWGNESIEKGKQAAISYSQVVVVPRQNLANKRVVTANVFATMATRLSPDGKSVAYLMHTQEGQVSNAFEEYGLYVASLESGVKAMLVDHPVAIGYDWREDSKAIAYLSADSENMYRDDAVLGTLHEKTVADANGSLLAEPAQVPEHGSAETHRCTGKSSELVGAVFYSWFKVKYGLDNRIFFSSLVLPLPVSKRDEPGCSLFCYDPVTATVTNLLPLRVSSHVSGQVFSLSQFALSPNGEYVLLPIKDNRFIVYELGTDSMEIPIPEDEGFGEDELPEMAPSWKGNNEITFMVSETSHFLPKPEEGTTKPAREEVVVLRMTDKQSRVLSQNWPGSL
jgi:hypothetical protein